jgi:hypothetical protein
MNVPSFRRRPFFVRGMPIALETRDLNAETPRNLQIEKPPQFTFCHCLPLEPTGASNPQGDKATLVSFADASL